MMKSLALLALLVVSAAAGDVGTILTWSTPSPAPQIRPWPSPVSTPYTQPPTPLVPASVDTETRPLVVPVIELATSAPTTPAPTAPLTTVPTPTTVAPTQEPTAPAERAESTPEPTTYVPPPIPEASADSPTFQLVEPVVCDDKVAKTIQTIYSKNRKLFDMCAHDSAYQIFPYSGTPPTPTQIHALVTCHACAGLFAAVVNANLPECDMSGISIRSIVETLLKIAMDVEHGLESPNTERFHNMHIWRRNSNLAKAAGLPYGNDSALYAEYARELPEALAEFSVQVQDDRSSANKTLIPDDLPGAVHASSGATDDGSSRAAANVTVKVLSSARPQYAVAGSSVVARLGMLAVTIAALVV